MLFTWHSCERVSENARCRVCVPEDHKTVRRPHLLLGEYGYAAKIVLRNRRRVAMKPVLYPVRHVRSTYHGGLFEATAPMECRTPPHETHLPYRMFVAARLCLLNVRLLAK